MEEPSHDQQSRIGWDTSQVLGIHHQLNGIRRFFIDIDGVHVLLRGQSLFGNDHLSVHEHTNGISVDLAVIIECELQTVGPEKHFLLGLVIAVGKIGCRHA